MWSGPCTLVNQTLARSLQGRNHKPIGLKQGKETYAIRFRLLHIGSLQRRVDSLSLRLSEIIHKKTLVLAKALV